MAAVAVDDCPFFSVGDSFQSFSELEEKLQAFKAKNTLNSGGEMLELSRPCKTG